MGDIRPKLVVSDGNAAIAFYAEAFGATVVDRVDDGSTVIFAELALLNGRITLKDADDHDPSPTTLGRPGVLLDVITDRPDEIADRALAAGAEVIFPVRDQSYGARGGRIRDPYGHEWLVQTPAEPVDEQVQEALDGVAEG